MVAAWQEAYYNLSAKYFVMEKTIYPLNYPKSLGYERFLFPFLLLVLRDICTYRCWNKWLRSWYREYCLQFIDSQAFTSLIARQNLATAD
jgi:hypothetical protein